MNSSDILLLTQGAAAVASAALKWSQMVTDGAFATPEAAMAAWDAEVDSVTAANKMWTDVQAAKAARS